MDKATSMYPLPDILRIVPGCCTVICTVPRVYTHDAVGPRITFALVFFV